MSTSTAMHSDAAASAVRDGGCTCGALRYRLHGDALSLAACHCTDCQRGSGGAFSMSMIALRTAFELVKGTPSDHCKIFEDDGRQKHKKFCGNCGTHLWTEFSKYPQIVNIKPGTLDDTRWLHPVAHVWLRSAQPWVSIPESALRYDTQPADYGEIMAAWQKQLRSSKPGT